MIRQKLHFAFSIAAITLAIGACGEPPEPATRAELERQGVITAAPQPSSRPEFADWAAPLQGSALTDRYAMTEAPCMGYADVVVGYFDDPEGARIQGWAWDPVNSTSFQRLVVTDSNGMIVGAGSSEIERPDVADAYPQIDAGATVGFDVITTVREGPVTFYGVDASGETACLIAEFSAFD